MLKIYIVVLRSLSVGLKCAQACHALRAFIEAYPTIDHDWYVTSNNIVVLESDDLIGTAARLDALGLSVARFHEPDRDDELTALCAEPGASHALRRYPLAGSTLAGSTLAGSTLAGSTLAGSTLAGA